MKRILLSLFLVLGFTLSSYAEWSNPNPQSGGDTAGQLLLKHESNMTDLYAAGTGKLNQLKKNFASVSAPSSPDEGQAWWDSANDEFNIYTGTTWIKYQKVAVGTVQMYAGSTAPTGYLICDGSAVSRTTYAALFAVIGTTYGEGDGSTTFNLPNLKGRAPIGVGQGNTAEGGGLGTNRALATTGGAETHTLTVLQMPSHNHGVTDPGHSHTYTVYNIYSGYDSSYLGKGNGVSPNIGNFINSSTTGISIQNAGGGQAHNTMMPFIALNFIIKY